MTYRTFSRMLAILSLVVLVTLASQVSAQPAAGQGQRGQGQRRGGFGVYGDWVVTMEYNNMPITSIMSFSRDRETRVWTGQWISFRGITDLTDVKFEENNLTFKQTFKFGDQEFTSEFAGKLEEGKITGTLKNSRGERELVAERARRTPRCVGNWAVTIKAGEREFKGTLIITADKEGALSGKWKSSRGENAISDLKYERGALSFKRTIDTGDNKWETSFEGTIRGSLTGVFKSERGEAEATGELIGAAAIGRWNLEIASEQATRKQRLTVNPDMSGMYGAMAVEKIALEDDQISFKIVRKFGEREFEMNFSGKIEEGKLTGELKTARGAQKVTGAKVVRTFNRQRQRPASN